jgi:hypothetical protein
MQKLAELLIAEEAKAQKRHSAKATSFEVSARLRPQLVALMGTAGYRAVVSRALTLATDEVKWLHHVRVALDGTIEGLEDVAAQLPPGHAARGRLTLLAHLLELLVSFIGEGLTFRLLQELYPHLSENDFEAAKEG